MADSTFCVTVNAKLLAETLAIMAKMATTEEPVVVLGFCGSEKPIRIDAADGKTVAMYMPMEAREVTPDIQ